MMNCSQGINQKKCILFFWESSTDWLKQTLLSNGKDATDSCTDISNYLLSYT